MTAPRTSRLNAGLICFVMTFLGMTFAFFLTVIFMNFVKPGATGVSVLLGSLGLGAVCGLPAAVMMVPIGLLFRQKHTGRRLMLLVLSVIICFCSLYLIGDVLLDSPQDQLFAAIEKSYRDDSFFISAALARDLGWVSILVFPIFLLTGILDLLCLPFLPFFNEGVHAQFLESSVSLVGILFFSFIPGVAFAYPMMLYFQRKEEDAQGMP